jgi:glutaminase
MMQRIWDFERESEEQDKEAKDPKHWKLSREDFCKAVAESMTLISRTLQNNLIVPSWGYFCGIIKEIYDCCQPIHEGKVASYIPQLARTDPNRWGLAICTIDGQRFALGNSKEAFCLQSVSKTFNYALAASELGADVVHQYVGQEVGLMRAVINAFGGLL